MKTSRQTIRWRKAIEVCANATEFLRRIDALNAALGSVSGP